MKYYKFLAFIMVVVMLVSMVLVSACAEKESPAPAPAPAPVPSPAAPVKPIELTYGSINPATHTYSVADVAWIEKMSKDTNGRVKITPYWSATLVSAREATDELIKGVADIGYCSPGYSALPYPLHTGTLGFYYGVPDYAARRHIYDEVTAKYAGIEGEFKGIKILATSVGSMYQLITNKPVRTLEDFKGLQVKGTGVFLEVLKALGATGISMPMGEVYTNLDKGIVDGCLAPFETFASFHFGEVAKYATVLNFSSAVYPTRGMNIDSWNKLPKDIQDVFEKNIAFWEAEDDKGRFGQDQEGYEVGLKDGVEYIELSPADLTEFYQIVEQVMLQEVSKLEGKGLPGTEIYKMIRSYAK
ncbi:MAG TPA: TRAP transporter substrate-binding protein DctP [Dehalococcoidales bacterium]|nr:TRAP transporter substrate-binding protein DctP [Dehalococcoidales bacterium]